MNDEVAQTPHMDGERIPVTGYVQVIQDPFEMELRALLNRYSKENGSSTPDFQLSGFLIRQLALFDETVRFREAWYGRHV